jgi:hypothetical protein
MEQKTESAQTVNINKEQERNRSMNNLISAEQIAEHFGWKYNSAVDSICNFHEEYPQFIFPTVDELYVDESEFFHWYYQYLIAQEAMSETEESDEEEVAFVDEDDAWKPRLIYGAIKPEIGDDQKFISHLGVKRAAELFCGHHEITFEFMMLFCSEFNDRILIHGDDLIVEEEPFIQWMKDSACGQYPICANCDMRLNKIA